MTNNTNEVDQLAHELAYEAARSYIESFCGHAFGDAGWRDTTVSDDPEAVRRAVRYLELRNQLDRHVKRNTVVRVLDAPEVDRD
jgi:hypothetical protein